MIKKLNTITPYATDLFGQVPVLISEIDEWMLNVPHYREGVWRDYYVTNWRVVEKIQDRKIKELARATGNKKRAGAR